MEEASYLAKLADEVYLIHRRDYFRASEIMVDAKADPKIKFMVPYGVTEALFDNMGLNGIKVKNTGQVLKRLKLTVFSMQLVIIQTLKSLSRM